MSNAERVQANGLERGVDAILALGRPIFALTNVALGIQTLVCTRFDSHSQGPEYHVIPCIPWLPAIPWLAWIFGLAWIACGLGMLFKRALRPAAMTIGTLLFVCVVLLDAPKYARHLGDMGLRTTALEPLAIACLAWLLPNWDSTPRWLVRCSHYLLALAMIVFGVDHFLGLQFISSLLPAWIPWHPFWVAFFGAGFIAAGVSFATNLLERWGAACIGLMFGIWVLTLHLPRVLGLYGIPNAPHNPEEWSSMFIACALWGGPWAVARLCAAR
jgi:uncharacterized membrane protein